MKHRAVIIYKCVLYHRSVAKRTQRNLKVLVACVDLRTLMLQIANVVFAFLFFYTDYTLEDEYLGFYKNNFSE